jgi:transposase
MHKGNQKKAKGPTAPKKIIIKMRAGLPIEHPHAAGIDVGDVEFCVATRVEDGRYEVSTYSTFTQDLDSIVNDLQQRGITTVAMESTGVYYVPLYLKLEQAGIEPYLVNARHAKNVTGRKQDDTDAIWLQKLHTCGLLQKSFQPSGEERTLRDLVRQRKTIVTAGADSIRRMQKALELMNIKIHTVISDITGKTGMKMISAIIKGERDAHVLAGYKDGRIKASQEAIVASLEGIWRREHLFALQQSYEFYQFSQKQLEQCDEQIKMQLDKQTAMVLDGEIYNGPATPAVMDNTEPVKKKQRKQVAIKNQYKFDMRSYMAKLLGTDLCEIPGISEITVSELIAEIGTDINKWGSEKRFTGWLNLCPNTKISGGKVISSRIMKKKNHAGLCLRMAAMTVGRSKTPLGDYYRRMKGKLGGKGAVVATANKLAKIIYTMLKNKIPYDTTIYEQAKQKFRANLIKYYQQRLADLTTAA